MKMTGMLRFSTMLILILLAVCSTSAIAANTGTFVVTDASNVKQGENGTVSIFLNGDLDPGVSSLQMKVYYDSEIASAKEVVFNYGAYPGAMAQCNQLVSPIGIGIIRDQPIPNNIWLCNINLTAGKDDGNATSIRLVVTTCDDRNGNNLLPNIVSIHNGTFKTKDEVAPVITLTTPVTVSPTFNIAGTITDVGGMGTAQATLKNATHTESVALQLSGSAPAYTFSEQVTWPIEDGVNLTVTATDAAGNYNSTEPFYFNVVKVGFSDLQPPDGSYIKAIPEFIQAFMTEIEPGSVKMYLSSTTSGTIDLKPNPSSSTGYVKNTTLIDNLADGQYWVNVSGTGAGSIGGEWFRNWTFTLDTVAPVINSFTIADSDGDGYIEAGETLTLNWDVADLYFNNVALVDVATGEVLWSNNAASGSDTTQIEDGNRDLAFRAYDKAGNYGSRAFHLY